MSVTIDPNTNEAWIMDGDKEVSRFKIGTGDVTGKRYGKPYYTPTGNFTVINKVPYDKVEGGFGPMWVGLSKPGYGLHGQHEVKSLDAGSGGFVNEGYVSHGCVRFRRDDILKVGRLLRIGSKVNILAYTQRGSGS